MSGVTIQGTSGGCFCTAFGSGITVDGSGVLGITDQATLETNGGTGLLHITSGSNVQLSGSSTVAMDAGDYTMTNQGLSASGTAQIDSPNGAVFANFASAQGVGHTVEFTDASIADGTLGAVAAWSWDFGDSGTSTSQSPSHTYAAAGTYSVTLTATTSGSATSTCTIQVTVS